MLSRTTTATLYGLKPLKIEIEIDTTPGLPGCVLIGLANQAVTEAKERITAALLNCGIKIRPKRTIINLAPADIPKTGSSFDLAIAVGLLQLYQEVQPLPEKTMYFGELSLTGELKPIKGALPLVLAAKQLGYQHVFVPSANCSELSVITGISIFPLDSLKTYISTSKGNKRYQKISPELFQTAPRRHQEEDFSQIHGQDQAKRALEIAAAGGHNVYLVGPPGTGKSMLAKALSSILPPLTESEAVELTTLYSLAGLTQETGLVAQRPFRTIHHTISQAGLIGGGANLSPGEISLAHHGILFLDEFPEFPRYVLEALRQPLENKTVTISRARGSVEYPANCTLVAAANPCPCGYWGSQKKACSCSEHQRLQYQAKVSGPLLDRIDLHVWVGEVSLEKLVQHGASPQPGQSHLIAQRVQRARLAQKNRFGSEKVQTNCELTPDQIRRFCNLSPSAKKLLLHANQRLHLSARAYYKIIKVAQTIADLAAEPLQDHHLAEALQYREPLAQF